MKPERDLDLRRLRALLRARPHFRRLWLAELVSQLGDWLTYVAVSLLALHAGEGLLAVAGVLAAHSLPSALVGPLAGRLADRIDRRRLLIGAALGQTALTLAMAVAAAADELLLLELLLLLRTGLAGLASTASGAALPQLVAREELGPANALASASWSLLFTLGVAAGGLLSVAIAPAVVVALDALSFALAAGLLTRLPSLPPEPADGADGAGGLATAWRVARRDPGLLGAVLAKTPLAIAGGAGWVLMNARADELRLLGSGALTLGLVQAMRGLGTGVGPFLADRVDARWPGHALPLAAGLALGGVAVLSGASSGPSFLIAAFVWGAGVGANWVLSTAALQRRAPDAVRGRLVALDATLFTLGSSGAALAAGALADATGSPELAAGLGALVGLGVWRVARSLEARPARGAESSLPIGAAPAGAR